VAGAQEEGAQVEKIILVKKITAAGLQEMHETAFALSRRHAGESQKNMEADAVIHSEPVSSGRDLADESLSGQVVRPV
jgi:hypothetical protein